MENNFEEIIEECKNIEVNIDGIKLLIKRIQDKIATFAKNVEGEIPLEEVILEFINAYKEENTANPDNKLNYQRFIQYKALKKIQEIIKKKPSKFNELLSLAKQKEQENNDETLKIQLDLEEEMIYCIRNILRKCKKEIKSSELSDIVDYNKLELGKIVKNGFIESIQKSIAYLDEFRFIDDYIEMYNERAVEFGLERLKLVKRNPIPDEQYDEKGKLVKDTEDIGVLDSFSKENLEQLSLESLSFLDLFWKSRYYGKSELMNIALQIIEKEGLWKDLASGKEIVNDLDNDRIKNIMTQIFITRRISINNIPVTPEMEDMYKTFLTGNGLEASSLENDARTGKEGFENRNKIRQEVSMLETMNVIKMLQRDMNVKRYSILEDENLDSRYAVLVIELPEFRGPMLVEIDQAELAEYIKMSKNRIPKFENYSKEYLKFTALIGLISNKYYRDAVKKEYQENPTAITAALAGKKNPEER